MGDLLDQTTNTNLPMLSKGGIYNYSNDFNVRWSIPAFKGYTGITCSSISMGGSIATSQDTGEAPFYIHCSASNVTCVGSRLNSSLAVNPYEHLEHRWTVTKDDLSPCEYGDEITDPNSKKTVNPYTDQIGGEAAFLLREAGDYIITLVSTSANGTTNTIVKNITVSVPTYGHLFIDGAAGNESNDGLDPWGFGLTNASYTNATRQLTQIGAFASYDHAAATASVSTDNYNRVYVDGHGLLTIESQLNADTLVVVESLGSDLTGLTSSDGPKQTLTTAKVVANRFVHLKGDQTYLVTSNLNPAQKDSAHIGGYAGLPTISPDTGYTSSIYDWGVGSSGFQSDWITMHNVHINCLNQSSYPYGGVNSSSVDGTGGCTFLIDRTSQEGSANEVGVTIQIGAVPSAKTYVVGMWGSDYNNLKVASEGKRQGIYSKIDLGFISSVGCTHKSDCDDPLLDHHWYINGTQNNRLITWDSFPEGTGANYCLNINTQHLAAGRSKYTTIAGNAFSNARFGFDLSETNNTQTLGFFEDVIAARNSFKVLVGGTLYFNSISLAMLHNAQGPADNINDGRLMISPGDSSVEAVSYVMDGNVCFNTMLTSDITNDDREIINNINYNERSGVPVMTIRSVQFGADVYFGNNSYYTPNNTTPVDDNSILKSVATFDSENSFTNNINDPAWLDPDVGDFF